jgi:phosphoribosylformylglycinamidine synthase
LLGEKGSESGGSEYLKVIHGFITGDVPDINIETEKNLQDTVLDLIDNQLINSAHDISEGGLAIALAECCIMNISKPIGCNANFNYNNRKDFELFGETQSRIIISAEKENAQKIYNICKEHNIIIFKIGETGGIKLSINNEINLSITEISDKYYYSIERIMDKNS